jgi:hypothetical protein
MDTCNGTCSTPMWTRPRHRSTSPIGPTPPATNYGAAAHTQMADARAGRYGRRAQHRMAQRRNMAMWIALVAILVAALYLWRR